MSVQDELALGIVIGSSVFQYILCVGSRAYQLSRCFVLFGFNTSYVSVQDLVIPIWSKLVPGFNTSYVSVQVKTLILFSPSSGFQYILCVGSSSKGLYLQ